MRIDNKKNIYKIWLSKLITTIIFTGIIAVLLIFDFFPEDSVITKYHAVIAASIFFILLSLVRNWKKPFYFFFSDSTDVLIFRFYPVGLFNSRKNSVEIPKQHFIKFESTRFFLGMEEKITLHQSYRNKEAKYPPISLSAVNKDDRERLKKALIKYSKKD